MERGVRFLLDRQGDDGLWRDFHTPAGEASEWPTAFVAAALHRAGAAPSALERAAEALVATQKPDGGWGYNEEVPTDADSTAWALHFLGLMGGRPTSCRRAAACLLRHQRWGDGGIATYSDAGPIRRFMRVPRLISFGGWCRPHTEVTAVAGRALLGLARPEAEAAWHYVQAQQSDDGSWTRYWWTSSHYSTLEAAELGVAMGDQERAARAADWAMRAQQDDGGWTAPGAATSAFATALSVSILLLAGSSGEAVKRAIGRLVDLQQEDGGWPSHPIMRIPLPGDRDPDRRARWRPVRFGSGAVVADQHRTFTSASCVAALARAGTDRGHP